MDIVVVLFVTAGIVLLFLGISIFAWHHPRRWIAVAAVLLLVIGFEGYTYFFNEKYKIERIEPYVDPYTSLSEAELQKKMKAGDLDAMAEMGNRLMAEGKQRDAYKLWMEAANKGNGQAENSLGSYFEVEKKYGEAFEWYLKSSKHSLYGLANLGRCYLGGLGVEKDEKKGLSFLKEAAFKGLAKAQWVVGNCYFEGVGIAEDKYMAFRWYKKAAEEKCTDAYASVGLCYERGCGVEKDERKAVEWYKKAADEGNSLGLYCLAYFYYEGLGGLTKNWKKTFELFYASAEKGNIEAIYALGTCYEYGTGTTKDFEKAFECYYKAAENGNAQGQYGLALCYLKGIGTNIDYDKARHWAELAAKQNDEDAKKLLAELPKVIEQRKKEEEEYQRLYGHLGTFEFKDKLGHTWVLTVKEDETATIRVIGESDIAYASWYRYDGMKYANFSCSGKSLRIAYPGSELLMGDYGQISVESCSSFSIDGKYIYYDSSAADSKNPELRLPLKRIR